jgi:hypothetical protein
MADDAEGQGRQMGDFWRPEAHAAAAVSLARDNRRLVCLTNAAIGRPPIASSLPKARGSTPWNVQLYFSTLDIAPSYIGFLYTAQ